jgi:hypothetical protein
MSVVIRLIFVLVLVWIILLVVAHPAVDLPQTVVRTGQLLRLLSVMCSALAVVASFMLRSRWSALAQLAEPSLCPCNTLLEKNCVQRC